MNFESRFKEMARAHVAVDRLRDVHQRIAEREEGGQARRDLVLRVAAATALAWLVIEVCSSL